MNDLIAFGDRWFGWDDLRHAFWGRVGRPKDFDLKDFDLSLASVRASGGLYCVAFSAGPPARVHPTAREAVYFGETSAFGRRMEQFASSAGFWGERRGGHYAAWWWPAGRTEGLWVSFYVLGDVLPGGEARDLRRQVEAEMLAAYFLLHGRVPRLNGRKPVWRRTSGGPGASV
jgi:hypothetical protein